MKTILVQQVANDFWFRQVDYVKNKQERMVRRNLKSSEEDLMALALRTSRTLTHGCTCRRECEHWEKTPMKMHQY